MRHIVIGTAGHIDHGKSALVRSLTGTDPDRLQEEKARGITIDVIGVEMASRHTLATRVHSYRNANNPESLRQAISEVFAEVASSDGGTAGEDAFELIADLPEVTASAML